MVYQGDVMNTLSYLLGERTVPTTGTEGRKDFIQRTLNEIYTGTAWKFNEALATLSVVNGLASLPSDLSLDQNLFVKYVGSSGNSVDLELVDVGDQDDVNIGDNKYWVTSYTQDGTFVLNTKEVISTIIVDYQRLAPILAASVGTPFKNVLTIAMGAKRYVKMSQDPEADISQDEALFQKRLQEDIRALQLSQPRIRRKTAQSQAGVATGDD
jgi:hypothetical protein